MSYEQEYTSISIRVPKSFRDKFNETKEFWKELGDFFVIFAGHVNDNTIKILKEENPTIFEFLEELLP